jgi:hypothetical protein
MNDVTAQQIRHFSQFGWIEYEEFLSPEECKKIYEHLQSTAFKRLQIRSLAQASTDRLYSAMRDCWRDQPWLKKLFLNQNFLSIAESLTGKKNLILACDQWVPEGKTFSPLILSSHLSFQNLACAAFFSSRGRTDWKGSLASSGTNASFRHLRTLDCLRNAEHRICSKLQ